MKDFEDKLKNHLHSVRVIEPIDLGHDYVTDMYKKVTSFLKVIPFIYLIPLSFALSFLMYIVLGTLMVKLTSLLQYGF